VATFVDVERETREIEAREARERLADAVRGSGLIAGRSRGVALVSGGPDSACLAAALADVAGPKSLVALHVNYGLREDSGEDEACARALCERLGIELAVEAVTLDPAANLQAAAREARYERAERLRAERSADWIATGHTRTDLAETVIYRLAVSPGRRALLGLRPRQGRVVRPLLSLGRDETRSLAGAASLPFRDDPSNEDPRFARVRLRREVLPVLRDLSPAAEENIAATWAELAEEAEALEALAVELTGGELEALPVSVLRDAHPALARLALRALAGRAAGRSVPLSREQAGEIMRLAESSEGGEVDLGAGLRALCEAGVVRVAAGAAAPADPVGLPVPGECRWGRWHLRVELGSSSTAPAGPDVATLDADALGEGLEVRAWAEGDRMRPLGLDGSKALQDLFTDRRVPRSLRHELPVVTAGERIAWVAGVAVAEDFRLGEATERVAILTASRVD
jgi:tRNA(Ile)-lysidine synthase